MCTRQIQAFFILCVLIPVSSRAQTVERILEYSGPVANSIHGTEGIIAVALGNSIHVRHNNQEWIETEFESSFPGRNVTFVYALNSDTLFAYLFPNAGINISIDSGNTWSPAQSAIDAPGKIVVSNQGVLVANTLGGIYLSENRGVSWQRASGGYPQRPDGLSLAGPLDSLIIAGAEYGLERGCCGSILYSFDDGRTWADSSHIVNDGGPIFWAGSLTNELVLFRLSVIDFIRKNPADNLSVTWSDIGRNFTQGSNTIFLTIGGQVHRSKDGGLSWLSLGIPSTESDLLYAASDDILYISGQGYVDRISSLEPTSTGYHNEFADLFSVFPNPTLDRISVLFEQENAVTQILIFNSVGKKVMQIDTPGFATQTLDLDVSILRSGLYFVVVQLKNTRVIKSFIVL